MLPEYNYYRILEIQILVFTHIHSCKCGAWPKNFIQGSNLPLTSMGFCHIWTKQSNHVLHLQSPPFIFQRDCWVVKMPKSCQFVQTRYQISFLIFSFSNMESNTAKYFITILLGLLTFWLENSHFTWVLSPALCWIYHLCCAINYTNTEKWVYDLEWSFDKLLWRHTWNTAQ